ncbi:hypothetical protein [Archangium lipolyticum]|uniref:hypothetical protein n=1 Tax=Archangium lipolyticum TaxID=2970465 RepID=UPI00214A6EBC|nr:hypothetical protein [Archangium lipolyticum]
MTSGQPASLQLPAFLHGTYPSVQRKTRKAGQWFGEQYRKNGTFPLPREVLEIPPGEVVSTLGVADFQHEQRVWRLYMVSNVLEALWETLEDQNSLAVRNAYEESFHDTAWGALFFALAQMGPVSAERAASRLRAVLRFWEPLQTARYLFMNPGTAHTLEELMVASCPWALDAWCPEEEPPVRARLELAVERMARATREDSIEAILRQMPRAISSESGLKHRQVLADPAFQRERLASLAPLAFERVSAARTADLIGLLHDWEHELGMQ